jgi:hypothetical protein
VSKTSKLSLEGLQKLTDDVSELLPVADRVNTLGSDVKSLFQGFETRHQQSEINVRDDLKLLQSHLTDVKALQKAMNEESKADNWTQLRWQKELQLSVQGLADCTKTKLELLLKIEAEKKISQTSGGESLVAKIPAAVGQVLQVIGNGIAGAIGTYIALNFKAENNALGRSPGSGRQNAYRGSSMGSLTHTPKYSSANSRVRSDQPAFYQLFSSGESRPIYDDTTGPRSRRV